MNRRIVTIRPIKRTKDGRVYSAFLVIGYLNGERVRRQFPSREEALGEKNRLEVEAANVGGEMRARSTRLNSQQLAEAEAAFARLGPRPLDLAVQWFLDTYRPPTDEMTLDKARDRFLTDRTPHVGVFALRDYKNTLKWFVEAHAGKCVHEIKTTDVQAYLDKQGVGPKRHNNLRGDLNAFFAYCAHPLRLWTRENPVKPIQKFKLARGVPEILTVQKAADLMAFLETFDGGPQRNQVPGFLCPYFALALFAGLRPSLEGGEIKRLARDPKVAERINLDLGVIKITPQISKVRCVRDVTVQSNLAAWLRKYPIDQYPIIPSNVRRMVKSVRRKFKLSQDVLRHSFISMHVAKFKSLGTAALEAGNSESMVRRHYLAMASAADAEKFWSILPKAPRFIVSSC